MNRRIYSVPAGRIFVLKLRFHIVQSSHAGAQREREALYNRVLSYLYTTRVMRACVNYSEKTSRRISSAVGGG